MARRNRARLTRGSENPAEPASVLQEGPGQRRAALLPALRTRPPLPENVYSYRERRALQPSIRGGGGDRLPRPTQTCAHLLPEADRPRDPRVVSAPPWISPNRPSPFPTSRLPKLEAAPTQPHQLEAGRRWRSRESRLPPLRNPWIAPPPVPVLYPPRPRTGSLTCGFHRYAGALHGVRISPKLAVARGSGRVAPDSAFKTRGCGPPGPAPTACLRRDWLIWQVGGASGSEYSRRVTPPCPNLFQGRPGCVPFVLNRRVELGASGQR